MIFLCDFFHQFRTAARKIEDITLMPEKLEKQILGDAGPWSHRQTLNTSRNHEQDQGSNGKKIVSRGLFFNFSFRSQFKRQHFKHAKELGGAPFQHFPREGSSLDLSDYPIKYKLYNLFTPPPSILINQNTPLCQNPSSPKPQCNFDGMDQILRDQMIEFIQCLSQALENI